jgi:hypothetical protein
MATLEEVRRKLTGMCMGTKLEEEGVHAVTFQPMPSKVNQDRLVTEQWNIDGQTWLFLAVCDGEPCSISLRDVTLIATLRPWRDGNCRVHGTDVT